jgi:preprotein translocase YajC subunit
MGSVPEGGNPWLQLVPFALVLGIFYFIILLPTKRKQQKVQAFLDALKVNDKIVTTGGIYGQITRLTDQRSIFAFFRVFWKDLHERYSFVNDQRPNDESPFGDLDENDPMYEFFRRFFPNPPQQPQRAAQQEIAAVLRCSVHKIARLRRDEGLPWLPGRPVLIPEEEFYRWLSHRTIRASGRFAKSGSTAPIRGDITRSAGPTLIEAPAGRAQRQKSSRRLRIISNNSAPTPKPR